MVSRITMLIATVAAAVMLGHSVGLKIVEASRPAAPDSVPAWLQCEAPELAVTLTATSPNLDVMSVDIASVKVAGESPWKYYREVSRVGSTRWTHEPGMRALRETTAYICLVPGN